MGATKSPMRISDLPSYGAVTGSELIEIEIGNKSWYATLSQLFSAGDSAYQVAVKAGFQGTVTAWLASLVGPKGDQGIQGIQGIPGVPGVAGSDGLQGAQGLSAYEVAVADGYVGTQVQWLASLQGPKGDKGDQGIQGIQGLQGLKGDQGIQGVQGLQGVAGLDGKTIRSGSGAPSNALGVDGDFYVDYTNSVMYGPRAGGVWPAGRSLIGPQGIQGIQGIPGVQGNAGANGTNGVNGATWYNGNGLPGVVLGVAGLVNDYYVNNLTGDYYQKIDNTPTWNKVGTLTGVQQSSIGVACSDETTAITTGVKSVFRVNSAFQLTDVRASLSTAQATGALFTVNVKVNGTSIFQTPMTFDNTERTTKTAAILYGWASTFVGANRMLNDDDEVTVEVTQVGDGTAKGLKVYLVGYALSNGGAPIQGITLNSVNQWTASQSVKPVILGAVNGIYTPDALLTNNFQLTLTGNVTIANPLNLVAGMTLNFTVDQDATGGRTLTLGSLFKWPGGVVPVWVTTAGAKNFFSAYYDGTILRCGGGAGYA